ncbi:hypothetical protein CYMTET_19870, partial [Cymbomonas tetramitiformis]
MSDCGGSIPDLDSGSDSGGDDDYYDDHRGGDFGDLIAGLDSGSDSCDDDGQLPSDAWACDRVWIEDTKWLVVVLFKDSHTVEQLDLKMLQHDELEALVQIKKALLMMDEEDVPAGVKLLDMSLVLKTTAVQASGLGMATSQKANHKVDRSAIWDPVAASPPVPVAPPAAFRKIPSDGDHRLRAWRERGRCTLVDALRKNLQTLCKMQGVVPPLMACDRWLWRAKLQADRNEPAADEPVDPVIPSNGWVDDGLVEDLTRGAVPTEKAQEIVQQLTRVAKLEAENLASSSPLLRLPK